MNLKWSLNGVKIFNGIHNMINVGQVQDGWWWWCSRIKKYLMRMSSWETEDKSFFNLQLIESEKKKYIKISRSCRLFFFSASFVVHYRFCGIWTKQHDNVHVYCFLSWLFYMMSMVDFMFLLCTQCNRDWW